MMKRFSAFVALCALLGGAPAAAAMPVRIAVHFDPSLGAIHGRLLVFLTQKPARAQLEPSEETPHDVEVLGTEIESAPAGATIEVPLTANAFPTAADALTAGTYTARAVLDVDHRYTYDGGQAGNPESGNVRLTLRAGATATIIIATRTKARERALPAPPAGAVFERFTSPILSAFFGRPTIMEAYVVPPVDYATSARTYATAYHIGGYGTSERTLAFSAARTAAQMAANGGTSLIHVYLNPRVPLGHSVFADSVNNGPWGTALTTELIPYLESRWRMTATPATRFLTGHSSGGWSTLWLQVAYPNAFGGTWSTSPDPIDFHDFTGPDLIDHVDGSMYYDRAGTAYPFVRVKNKDVALLSDYILQERALGAYGGQFGSFDAVFSPRGDDGRPQQLFDRLTGTIDPAVARAWEARYDIVHKLNLEWPQTGPALRGKIHIWVGTWDTFHLEGPVHRLDAALANLPNNDAHITFVPERDHFDLYDGPNGGLTMQIEHEMEAAAQRAASSQRDSR